VKEKVVLLFYTKQKEIYKMTNEFINYYSTVQEHAKDMVHEIYNELLDELKESSYGYSFETWRRLNESFLSEYNNHIYISLREAVEILEQSKRLISDEALYIEAGDCREQVKAMGYWTYRGDLLAEFKIALKNKLEEDIPEFESKFEQIEKQTEHIDDEIENRETLIQGLEELELESEIENKDIKYVQNTITIHKEVLESLNVQLEKLEEESQEMRNFIDNVESFINEL
jgi:hypothetical protein